MNYKVYQGTELKQTVTSKTAVMNGLQPNRTYEFGVQPSDGTRDGKKATTFVTTRGIRFNIPKTLTVGSNITLRYEEYPLGTVPIGNEPSGMFGGGNKQNLSAKVISTANGSSVVEVAGNVIDVGGATNLLLNTQSFDSNWTWDNIGHSFDNGVLTLSAVTTNGTSRMYQPVADVNPIGKTLSISFNAKISADYDSQLVQVKAGPYNNNKLINITSKDSQLYKIENMQWASQSQTFSFYVINGKIDISNLKLEQGTITTPYASFVDGDTFTAQPDGTFALFSEHKALYY